MISYVLFFRNSKHACLPLAGVAVVEQEEEIKCDNLLMTNEVPEEIAKAIEVGAQCAESVLSYLAKNKK